MQVNKRQLEMLLKAMEEFKTSNPDIEIDLDYKRLEREIQPINKYIQNLK